MAKSMNCTNARYEKCTDCGVMIFTRQKNCYDILCPDCCHNRRIERNKERNHRLRSRTLGERSYTVIKDPDPIGGFSPGNTFTILEHQDMLKMCCYTPGTILKGYNGKLYSVIKLDGMQALTPCPSA